MNRLVAVVAETERHGADTATVTGDLTQSTTVDSLAETIDRHSERIEVLVSNAGAYPHIPWDRLDLDTFRRQIEINLITHAACANLVTAPLTARPSGRIVAVSSVLTQLGRIDLAAYIAAKSGLEGLVRALSRELGPHGTTVNCVRAGSIHVPAEHDVVDDPAAMTLRQLDRQSIKRRGQTSDIAAAVDYLISPHAGFVTGQCLTVDGGWCLT